MVFMGLTGVLVFGEGWHGLDTTAGCLYFTIRISPIETIIRGHHLHSGPLGDAYVTP